MPRRPVRSRAAAGLLVAGLGLALTATAGSPVQAVGATRASATTHRAAYLDPASLPTGPAPKRAYLTGPKLTSKTGTKLDVPVPQSHAAHLTLLGNSSRGFVVEDYVDSYDIRFYAVPASGRKRLIFSTEDPEDTTEFTFSHDGTRLISFTADRSGTSYVYAYDLAGKIVDNVTLGSLGRGVLDFTGPKAVLGARRPFRWQIGQSLVPAGTRFPVAADIAHDRLFVQVPGGTGPTSLSKPGAPSWRVAFTPLRVSPNGVYVVGLAPNGRAVQVRKMATGALLSAKALQHPGDLIAWEDATHYLVVAAGAKGSALVRCAAVSGQCRRTTPLTTKRLTMSVS